MELSVVLSITFTTAVLQHIALTALDIYYLFILYLLVVAYIVSLYYAFKFCCHKGVGQLYCFTIVLHFILLHFVAMDPSGLKEIN